MVRLVGRGILAMIPSLILVSIIAFSLLYLVPGDPAVGLAGESPTPGQVELIRHNLGLDRPVVEQYLHWAGNALHGDFGRSIFTTFPVSELITSRLPITVALAVAATFVAVVVGLSLGIVAATWRGRFVDRAISALSSLGVAVPAFWLGLLLVLLFSVKAHLLPSIGYVPFSQNPGGWLVHILLPAVTLAAAPGAEIARQMRAAMVGVLGNDYVRTARAKGVRRSAVVLKHALKNAAVPVVTVIGSQFSYLLGGAVIVEQIFAIPGLGSLAVTAVLDRDMPVIQAVVVIAALAVLVVNLLVDLSYGYFSPKARLR
ncbi:ABC transporter permease [Amycolatopsis pithecellobii]|uniref:ABC transporter permease subunit n=1 Tax=Amycolatopsis pithecellobii TaxID=664692 RepID=A0A6N7YX06_9PSEU|nr:ABC transporter permease [Amycolatopsis pithecellobii]MTD57605.1 ABC transporter permease subunit [Amycolatopsis pithecellobii]